MKTRRLELDFGLVAVTLPGSQDLHALLFQYLLKRFCAPASSLSCVVLESKGHVSFIPALPTIPGTEQALTRLLSWMLVLILCLYLTREDTSVLILLASRSPI